MYNLTRINTALYKRLGWRQPTLTGSPVLDADNLASASGKYFQDFHRLVTVQNIKDSQEDSAISDVNFNTFLDNLQKASILKVLTGVFQRESDLIENKALYPYEFDFNTLLTNGDYFVGFEIEVAKVKDVAAVINSVMATFDTTTSLRTYLFHSDVKAYIESAEITLTANTTVNTALGWTLENQNLLKNYTGGKFYIGYYQYGLTPKAYDRDWNNGKVRNEFNLIGVKPFKVAVTGTGGNIFDIDDIEYTDYTWGLNFDFSTVKNYTNLIERNVSLFDDAVGMQMACDVLELIYTSDRVNRINRVAQETAKFELEGNSTNPDLPYTKGMNKTLRQELDRLYHIFNPKKTIKTLTLK